MILVSMDTSTWLEARTMLSPGLRVVSDQLPGPDGFLAAVVDCRSSKISVQMTTQWVVALVEENGFLPDFEGYSLAGSQKVQLERLGRPVIGTLKVAVFRRRDVPFTELPPIPYRFGPGVEPGAGWSALWPTDIFDGLGVPLWRDDPGVLDALFAAANGEGPLWISPGFAFTLPPKPMRLLALSGEMVEGLLCASTSEAGAWVMLSTADLSQILDVGRAVTYDELHKKIGAIAMVEIVEWVRRFPHSK